MRITSLHVYPVKSCGGISLSTASLDDRGIRHDRRWMVVSRSSGFLTQRQCPKMATITTGLSDTELFLSAKGMPDFALPIGGISPEKRIATAIWNDSVDAADQGDDVAQWLQAFLQIPDARLMRMCDDATRIFAAKNGAPSGQVGFADSRPLLVISEASLDDLNTRMPKPLPMDRFRPNIVVSGCDAYAEDKWHKIGIGSMQLDGSKHCTRCAITTIKQNTGEKDGKEPLRALSNFRKVPNGVIFGRYFVNGGSGDIRVNDDVVIFA